MARERLWTPGLIANFIVLCIMTGIGAAWTYYTGWIPLVEEGLDELIHALQEVNLLHPLWWRALLTGAFDILIISLFFFAAIWVWGNFAIYAHEFRKWRKFMREVKQGKRKTVLVEKFNLGQRIQHILIIVTFVPCAFTGFVMLYGNNPYWQMLYFSREAYVVIHVLAGIACGAVVLWHFAHYGTRGLIAIIRGLRKKGPGLYKTLPMTRLYTWSMIRESLRHIAYLFTPRAGKPRYHKYDFEQYFEYWGVYWGILVLGIPGAIMAVYGPQVLCGVFWVTHVKEAALAVLWIILAHFGSSHFNPRSFPIEDVFIKGKMPVERVKEEHPLWYEELREEGVVP